MSDLGLESVCCLLHNLVPGGSARQWIHLLGRHVDAGGRATIVAPDGPLVAMAREAGIDVVTTVWAAEPPSEWRRACAVAARHDAAIVHWDHEVMHGFGPVLDACGLAVLVAHQAPDGLARWFGPGILEEARGPLDHALRTPGGVLVVRGETHRRRFEQAFGIPRERMRILPAAIPIPPGEPGPAVGEPHEILALARFSGEKIPIQELAVELTRVALERLPGVRLVLAGEGDTEDRIRSYCERRLPEGTWRIEGAPADPIARLAAADLVVAQGLTTLEAAALGRRVVVAKFIEGTRVGGVVLTPASYDDCARDPFSQPRLSDDAAGLLDSLLSIEPADLRELRGKVERANSLEAASRALGRAFAETPRGSRWRSRLRRARQALR